MDAASPPQTLRRLTVIVALQWIGATLGLPLLPLFLEHRGGTPHVIGLIMAAFFVAGVLTQYVLGHASDRWGRRPIMVSALIAYGLASMTFALPLSALWFAGSRLIQGAAAGALEVTALSAVSSLYPEHERGRAVARILSAQLLGVAVGPLAGAITSVKNLGWVFVATGVASLVAAVVASELPLGDRDSASGELVGVSWSPRLVGSLVAGAATGLTIGVYEACWTLLMNSHHATTLEIRLSWTLFSIPWLALSRVCGWLADHGNRRIIALAGLWNGALFLSIYPHIHNNVVMLFVGSLESIGAAASVPAISSLLTQGAHPDEMGRRQGLFATAQTSALALAAMVSGFLFTRSPALPFSVVAVVSALLSSTTLWWWRDTRGRITHAQL